MAILTTEWYQSEFPRSKITEIIIANSATGRNSESWDASAAQDGSIMCYRGGTKVSIVCDSVTEIEYKAFSKFLALKKISGLGNVSTIGGYAFCYTPNLVSVDLVPANITSIGESAFRMSNIEDVIDLSNVSGSIGNFAIRSKRWGTDLNAVQSVVFPKTIYLDVPNSENQDNYPNVLFSDYDGTKLSVATAGCTALTLYHIWNYIHAGTDKEYANWLDWFNSTLNKDVNFAKNNAMLLESEKTWIKSLGWTPSANEKVSSATQLQTIIDRLAIGYPTYITMHSVNNDGGLHTLAIIGCDAKTHKLAVIDSRVCGTSGVVAWLAFEDIFVGGASDFDRMMVIDYNLPVLAPNSTWFTQGNTGANKSAIIEVRIKDTYTPAGTPNFSWDASASKDGSVMAYIEGNVLTLAGNGHGKISMNADSANFFNSFGSLTKVDGGSYLDTSRVNSFERMFQACFALEHLDVSTWNTSNATTLKAMYQGCKLINKLDVSKWNTSNVTDISYFLNMPAAQYANNNLTELNVSNWDVSKVTNMRQFANLCYALDGLDVSKWDTSLCTDMYGMFYKCSSISTLDLSNWNTAKVTTFTNMLAGLNNLKYLKLGSEFGGTSKSNLVAPSASYIPGADGKWYDIDGNGISPVNIQDNTHSTWYATKSLAEEDANNMVLVKKGNLLRTASAIRSKTETANGYTPEEIPSGIADVYEAGKKAENVRFWDGVLSHYDWTARFYGSSWNDRTFRPAYDIKPTGNAANLFNQSVIQDIPKVLEECGVVFDTSGITGRIDNMFYYCTITKHLPYIDVRNASWNNPAGGANLQNLFHACREVHTIDGLHLRDNGTDSFDSTFGQCYALENLTIYGTIGQNKFDLQFSTKLSKASITNVINALSSTTSGLSITLSKTAVETAFGSTTATEWTNLIGTKSNWTINLV